VGGSGGMGSSSVNIAGKYDLTSQFNLLDALPDDIKAAIEGALSFADSPGAFLLNQAGKLPVIKYVIAAIDLFSGIHDTVVKQIDDYLNSWSGGLLTTMHGISQDIEGALRGLKMHNRWTINTVSAANTAEVNDTLTSLTFTYQGTDYDYPQNAVGTATGLKAGFKFTLPAHTYNKGVNIGGILVDLIDNVALPQLTGVDSLGALLNQLVNCGGVGSWVWKEIGNFCVDTSNLNTCISHYISANDITKLCQNALNAAGRAIEDKISSINAPGMMSVSEAQSLILEQQGMTGNADTIMGGTWSLTMPAGVGNLTLPGQFTGTRVP